MLVQEKITFIYQKELGSEEGYQAALKLIEEIDSNLESGRGHYRNKAGLLLTTLDQIVRAIIEDNLLTQEA